jgi:3-phenylpropionate/cinnamic acid dioxygenase small subunit
MIKTSAIREKLYDYIRIADEKKIKAIYMILEDEITEEVQWWKDRSFTNELDQQYTSWITGKEKGYSLQEIDSAIEELKKRRSKK